MVREDHQDVTRLQLLHHPADERVVALVQLADRVLVLPGIAPPRRGMTVFEIAPEHVLDPVGAVEDADDGATALPLERGKEHRLALTIDVIRLLEKRRVARDRFIERPRVFGETEGRYAPRRLERYVA